MMKSAKFYLDVDGVILDFNRGLRNMLEKEYPDFYVPSESILQMAQNLTTHNKVESVQKIYEDFMVSPYFAHLPLLTDVSNILKLYELGDVTFVTNIRPDSIEGRRKNLLFHGIPDTEIIPSGLETYGDKTYPLKSQVIRTMAKTWHTSFFLDDLTENYADVKSNVPHVNCFIIRSFENAHRVLDDYPVVDDFSAFVQSAEHIILLS